MFRFEGRDLGAGVGGVGMDRSGVGLDSTDLLGRDRVYVLVCGLGEWVNGAFARIRKPQMALPP